MVAAQSDLGLCSSRKFALYDEIIFGTKEGVKRLYAAYVTDLGYIAYDHTDPRDVERVRELDKKHRSLLVEPVLAEVRDSVGKISRSSGVALRDGRYLEGAGVLLAFDESLNVTKALIKILNHTPTDNASELRLMVRDTQIGTIDTKRFSDPQSGIPSFGSMTREKGGAFCAGNKDCDRVMQYADEYMRANKLGAILDISAISAEKFTGPNCKDVTTDFIQSFNRRYP